MTRSIIKMDGVEEGCGVMVGSSMMRAWVDVKDHRDLTQVLVRRWE